MRNDASKLSDSDQWRYFKNEIENQQVTSEVLEGFHFLIYRNFEFSICSQIWSHGIRQVLGFHVTKEAPDVAPSTAVPTSRYPPTSGAAQPTGQREHGSKLSFPSTLKHRTGLALGFVFDDELLLHHLQRTSTKTTTPRTNITDSSFRKHI